MLKLKSDEYWIEPSKNHNLSTSGEHPHIIFQRSAVREKVITYIIGVLFFFSEINGVNLFNGQELVLQKKKRRRRKKHKISNCGTKEPKKITETRIEWQHQGKV